MQIFPTLLERNTDELLGTFNRLAPYFSSFQIDIQDGIFVNNKTASLEKVGSALINNRELFRSVFLNIDLMVADNETALGSINGLASEFRLNTLIHPRSPEQYARLTTKYPHIPIGIALSPADTVTELASRFNLADIPVIQIMTVNPGPQGQPFMPEMLEKIDRLRENNYRNIVMIDGSVNDQTIPVIMKRRNMPDIMVVGSYLTKTNELVNHVQYLKNTVPDS